MPSLRKFLLVAGLASSLCNGAVAAYLDFTDSNFLTSLTSSDPTIYEGAIDGISFKLTSSNGAINFNENYDGNNPSAWCQDAGTLACDKDGIGIDNDEITGENAQTLSLMFEVPVFIHSLEFLDLYDNRLNDKGREQATVNIDGTVYLVNANGTSGEGGYARLDLLSLGNPIQNILFSANPLAQLRDDSTNDYALAAASVSAVPIPAAVWLFGTALIGLVGFSKRRKLA